METAGKSDLYFSISSIYCVFFKRIEKIFLEIAKKQLQKEKNMLQYNRAIKLTGGI